MLSKYMTQAYVAIHCQTGKEKSIIKNLVEVKGIKEVSGVLGLYDILVKIDAEDTSKLEQIIITKIRKQQHVLSTMTLIVI